MTDNRGAQCGRTAVHAPEVDGTVFRRGPVLPAGTIVRARFPEATEHDLAADILEVVGYPWQAGNA